MTTIGNNISALSSFGTQMNVTANNVANVNTDGFKRSRTVLEEGQNGSVTPRVEKINTPGPVVQEGLESGETRELSNVDIAKEITDTIPTQRGYEANLKVVQTMDEMLGKVIDMKA